MASRLTRLGNFASRTAKRGVEYSGQKLPIFKKYALVELVPPTPVEMIKAIGQAGAIVKKGFNGGWKDLTIFQLAVGAAVMIEPPLWFFLGECIGRQGLEGYRIEGTKYYSPSIVDMPTANIGLDTWKLDIEPIEGFVPASGSAGSSKLFDDITV